MKIECRVNDGHPIQTCRAGPDKEQRRLGVSSPVLFFTSCSLSGKRKRSRLLTIGCGLATSPCQRTGAAVVVFWVQQPRECHRFAHLPLLCFGSLEAPAIVSKSYHSPLGENCCGEPPGPQQGLQEREINPCSRSQWVFMDMLLPHRDLVYFESRRKG